jgi:hypothetical protein
MNVIISPTKEFGDYYFPGGFWSLKRCLGYWSTSPVYVDGQALKLNGHVFEHHDLLHYEVSLLSPILLGSAMVSGIHGICLPFFPNRPPVSEYDGLLDELRVALHEWLTMPSIYNTFKLFNWFIWMLQNSINPFAALWRHYLSLRQFGLNTRQVAIRKIQTLEYQQM